MGRPELRGLKFNAQEICVGDQRERSRSRYDLQKAVRRYRKVGADPGKNAMKKALGTDTYVVDLCGTLVTEDTTFGLLRHYFSANKNRKIKFKLFQLLAARYSPVRILFSIAEKLSDRNFLKHCVLLLLRGEALADLEFSAEEYANHLFLYKRIQPVKRILDARSAKSEIILASASLEPIVAACANALGARYVASSLEQRDGILTGRYFHDITGRKAIELSEAFGASIFSKRICVMTDNVTDRSMLELADDAVVILHKPSHRTRWSGMNAKFIQVN